MIRKYYYDDRMPKYCTKCGSFLIKKQLSGGYDAYTGKYIMKDFLVCNRAQLDIDDHDGWEYEPIPEFSIQTYEGTTL